MTREVKQEHTPMTADELEGLVAKAKGCGLRSQAASNLVIVLKQNAPRLIEALRASEWQGMDSAPRDGSYVLLAFNEPTADTECPCVSVGKAIHGGGWWLTSIWAASTAHHAPTAWQPLPAPPATEAGE